MSGNTSSTGGYLRPTSSLPIDDDALSVLLHNLVVGVTNLSASLVRPRWQPQPPTMPDASVNWAAVGVVSTEPVGPWPSWVHNNNQTSTMLDQDELEVLATFYGPNSGSYAGLFQAGVRVQQNLEALLLAGFKLRVVRNSSHVPELVNTQYRGRSDVAFRLVREIDRVYAIKDIASAEVVITADTTPVVTTDTNITGP